MADETPQIAENPAPLGTSAPEVTSVPVPPPEPTQPPVTPGEVVETPTQPDETVVTTAEKPVEFDTINIGSGSFQIQKGAAPAARQEAIKHYITTPEFYETLNRVDGAPSGWRKAVGDAIKPEDKLATLKKYAPDAMPFGDDNFIYTDKTTNTVVLFNPKGFDSGDLAGAMREIVQGIGGTLGAIAGAPAAGVGAVPGAAAGVVTADLLYDFTSQLFGETQRSEDIIERGVQTATLAATAAAGQKAGDVLLPLAASGVKKVLGGGTAKAQAIFNSLLRHDIKPTAGVVTSGKGVGRIESGLDQSIAAATTMRNQVDAVVKSAQDAVETIAAKIGTPRTQQGTGEVLQKGAERALQAFTREQGVLETRLGNAIGDDTKFSIDALRELQAELKSFADQMPKFSQKAHGEILNTLDMLMADAAENGGRIPYSAFRQIRTFFGQKMSDMTEGANRGTFKRLYAAMTDDLETGAAIHGQGDMFKETVEFTKHFKTEYDDLLQKMVDFDAPEQGYRYVLNSKKDGGTSFRRLQEQFTPTEWADVSATIVQKMGHKNLGNEVDGGFSVNTFLSNMKNTADEAKDALFKEVVFNSIAASARLGNTSNTAGAAHALQLMDALGGNFTKLMLTGLVVGGQPAAAAGALAGNVVGKIITPLAVSKLMTNAAFVKWLAAGPAARSGAEVGGHMGRLTAVYQTNPEIRDALTEFMAGFNTTDDESETKDKTKAN